MSGDAGRARLGLRGAISSVGDIPESLRPPTVDDHAIADTCAMLPTAVRHGVPSSPPLMGRARVLSLLACILASGCGDRYPIEDALDDRRMTASAHLKALNRYLAAGTGKRQLAKQDSCHLVLKKSRDAGPGERLVIALTRSQVDIDSVPANEGLRVKVTQYHDGVRRVSLRLNVESWFDAVAWRSHFQQLQLKCRDDRERAAAPPPA